MIWAVSLSTMKLIPHRLTGCRKASKVFLVCNDLVPISQPASKQCFTPLKPIDNRCASTHFEEIQLALSSIGISPLTTTHPLIFQHQSVRTSTWFYPSFILVMVRSLRFGSIKSDFLAVFQTCFRSGFRP
jgi:hypothetical protein